MNVTFFYKLRRKFIQLLIAHSSDSRPTSYPYISGDTFRKICDHRHEAGGVCDPLKVKKGDSIFVESDFLKSFFKDVSPHIAYPYVLVSHNGDVNITEEYISYIDDKLIHWYAQNLVIDHPKITPLPIGLENMHFNNNGSVNRFEKNRSKKMEKKPRMLVAFNVMTNTAERIPALTYFKQHKCADVLPSVIVADQYLPRLTSYMFVVSPPGNGLDCIRTWEAMYVGVVPIVKKSAATTYFKKIGLPMYVVDSWNEFDKIGSNHLLALYDEVKNDFTHPALWAQFWIDKIRSHRNIYE